MVKKQITIGHLYPKQMNVYGDMGNVITLKYRLESRGYTVKYVAVNKLDELSRNVDILVGGGGQDSNQSLVQDDLLKHKSELVALCDDGVVALMICGMYQLFGNRFITTDGEELTGVGILDVETKADAERLIGNVVVDTSWGKLVGFENHSGRTYLGGNTKSLGVVLKGAGNNGHTGEEGAVAGNVFATYMHGPALTKNPLFADELIKRALERRYGKQLPLEKLDDQFERQASKVAQKRPY